MIPVGEWRPIPGRDGYEVRDDGAVRSLKRGKPRILRQRPNRDGYMTVKLVGTRWAVVHGLVAAAFIGPKPEGMQVRHLDGDKVNNTVSNLAYGTPSENCRDQVQHGTHRMAGRTHCNHGHPFSPENTRQREDGLRQCLTCYRERYVAKNEARRLRRLHGMDRLTLADLHHARGLYGGELTCDRGVWRLVDAKIAGRLVTLGPVEVAS